MSNPVGEVQITLKLDPRQASDRLALATLQRWYQRGSLLNSDDDAFDFFALRLHKDIYLSGVYLSLLEPELVKCFSRNLQLNCLTPAFFYHALEAQGLTPDVALPTSAGLDPLPTDALADLHTQVSRLQQQLQEQRELLQQQARLLDILTNAGATAPSTPKGEHTQTAQRDGDVQLHDLSATAAKVRKVREKGVF
ncbi:hypothetical protein [Pluralibacter sp.]|uniref:hypothetical protein n=1 Tax=Pluralibacter sp. TaxID=1920032 RepID=UPI0025D7BD48|nr:hypothetical protein [Pluralibacter sp.]MBV8043274.1 hypothetical protein [Pluralibacter sp.]